MLWTRAPGMPERRPSGPSRNTKSQCARATDVIVVVSRLRLVHARSMRIESDDRCWNRRRPPLFSVASMREC